MRAQELSNLLNQRPWKPVRFLFTGGERVAIRHPETVIVLRDTLAVVVRPKGSPIAEKIVHHNLLHLVKVEPLNGNGGPKRQRR
jgi:hypothetical protein